jgi:SAM-dependent methyltransferase
MDLKTEFEKRGPWITHFEVKGIKSGGTFPALEDERITQFFQAFPDVRTILELGSLEGGHTFALARHSEVERVLGIEARKSNIERARFMQNLLPVDNVKFVQADVEKRKLNEFGKFDAIFCSGLLYHLPEPWKLIAEMAHIAPRLFIWTHYADESAQEIRQNFRGREFVEGGIDEPLSGMSPTSFWLTLESLKSALTSAGFASIQIVRDEPSHSNGPAVTIAASISSSR